MKKLYYGNNNNKSNILPIVPVHYYKYMNNSTELNSQRTRKRLTKKKNYKLNIQRRGLKIK